jgi:protein TonB
MDFDAWDRTRVDALRVKRLLIGYVLGALGVTAAMAFVFLTSKGASAIEEEEDPIEAQLVKEPEPEPEPEPPPPQAQPEKPKPRVPKVVTPVEIPKEAPKEAEVKAPIPEDDDPFGGKDAPTEPSAKPAVVEAPKPPPPPKIAPLEKPKGPIRVTEDVTPPTAISQTQPEFPAAVKAAGIDGVVTVKFVVTETGQVTDVKVLKGPPELHAVCLAAVKSWRFKPAVLDGKPVAVVQVRRFKFRIKA